METLLKTLQVPEYAHKPIIIIIWAIVLWLIARFFKSQVTRTIHENENQYRIKKIIGFIAYLIIIIVFITYYSDNLSGFSVALGVMGAGIAFALQEVIASAAGWLALMFGNFYKPGDRVQLGGIKGDVIDISMLRTTLMEIGAWVDGDLYNGRIVRVANSFVFKEPVYNYSGDFPFLWDEIKVPIRYGSDTALARTLILNIAETHLKDYAALAATTWKKMTQKYLIENAKTDPMLTVVANDNWIEYTLRYVVNYKKRRMTKDLLFTSLLTAIEQTNGKIQFASATFEIVNVPKIKVSQSRDERDS